MAQLFALPKQVVLDSSGNPVPGAKANFYQTGTTTRQNVYTTSALSVAHANPVVADASGVLPEIWFDPTTTAYKLTLTTSADVLLYTSDPISVTFTQAQVGAILYPRTTAETNAGVTPTNYAYPPGDVRRYGTNTTPGTTDMTTAITNALACNDVVDLFGETYLISSALSIADNKTLRGKGSNRTTILTSANTFNAIEIASNARRVHLAHFGITGASVGASNAAISIHATGGCAQSVFEHLKIATFFTGILYGDLFWDSTVRDVRLDGCTRGAFSTGTSGNLNVVWERFYSEEHTTVGWQAAAVFNYNLIDCNFGGEQGGGQSQALRVTGASVMKVQGTNFESHLIAASTGVVEIQSSAKVEFDTCTWISNAAAAATGYELYLSGTCIVHVKNCIESAPGSNIEDINCIDTAQLVKHDDNLVAVHSAGSASTAIVRSPYQAQQIVSAQIDLSGSAVDRLVYVPKRAGRVTRIAAIYPEATSADAGITITVRTDDSTFTYASFTSHTSQAAWDVTELSLSTTILSSTRPVIVSSPGGKTGTGEIVIVFEFTED